MNQQLCHSSSHSVIVVLADTQLRQTRLILEIVSDLLGSGHDDDDVYHYIGERLKLEVETENMGVSAKKRKVIRMKGMMKAVITMATPCASGAYVHYVTSYSKMIHTTVA